IPNEYLILLYLIPIIVGIIPNLFEIIIIIKHITIATTLYLIVLFNETFVNENKINNIVAHSIDCDSIETIIPNNINIINFILNVEYTTVISNIIIDSTKLIFSTTPI